jgi:hypothetical protein
VDLLKRALRFGGKKTERESERKKEKKEKKE